MDGGKQDSERRDEIAFREFSEFNVDVMRAAASGSSHHSGIPLDVNDVSYHSVDLDMRFRSIQTVNPASLSEFAPQHYEPNMTAGPPTLSRKMGPTVDMVTDSKNLIDIVLSSTEATVPEKPFYIGPSHFECSMSISEIKKHVEEQLNQMFEVSYKFYESESRWEGVYMRGSSRCKFEVNVYSDGASFVVEGNRLSGDSLPFRNIYRSIKMSMTPGSEVKPVTPMSESIPLPVSQDLSAEDSLQALNVIVEMARASQLDTRAEAAKIFCDLSLQQNMHDILCDAGCLAVLVDLMTIDYDCCNQHAACALANLSASRSCQDLLVNNASFLPTLIKFTVDGPYDSSEMRRECARMLANICAGLAPRVVGNLGVDAMSSWVSGVANLKDERLKMHAERARQYILPCM
eukprot:CAMPEP_0116994760 /NCGR_PEP_ID=MMETSP0467-20121206/68335_1 /TAXON_ID=283647 /ORGANISM="Mesodinium pulex, Strain SPMC105" /LENGTH=403 /DNA_ID=CAMNT_0004692915 /DNA_START=57 /DNA_END=1268 /DNA_ORIENTATION=-